MRPLPLIASIFAALLGVPELFSQAAEPTSFLSNGGFEVSSPRKDLWNGVDDGYLAGELAEVQALGPKGVLTRMGMPISVAVADMNGDGLLDLVAMSPQGYLRIYFNSGTKTAPKFTIGEIMPVFLTRSTDNDLPDDAEQNPIYLRYAPHIYLYSARKSGMPDLYVGNYFGEVMMIPNQGAGNKPDFRQPSDLSQVMIPTNGANTKWGNLFAPCVWDANKDGKEDLLLGEGSYSANNVHLLVNSGYMGHPRFEDSNRKVMAYGDGAQHLTPTMVDYNGDGLPDLLVSDLLGRVALYLNPGGDWKPGTVFPFTGFIGPGGNSTGSFTGGRICTITTADLNGDGLFDLVFGKVNGRIAIAYNTGTPTAPKFGSADEVPGDPITTPLRMPAGWEIDFGLTRGNYFGYAAVVTAAEDPAAKPPEGKACLKFGYRACPNKILPPITASQYTGATDPKFLQRIMEVHERPWVVQPGLMSECPANYFLLRRSGENLKAGLRYTLSFKVKGNGMSDGHLMVRWIGHVALSDERVIESGDRGAAKIVDNNARSGGRLDIPFSASSDWSEVHTDFDTVFKDQSLNVKDAKIFASIDVVFSLAPGQGQLYIDDVKLTPR